MTLHTLYPGFIRLFYHTAFGNHTMTLPTRAPNPVGGTNGFGGYENWDSDPIDAKDMIDALVAELVDFHPATANFDNAIIYQVLVSGGEPNPLFSVPIDEPGTAVTADVPASQTTMTMRTTDFNISKLTWFDATPSTDFLPLRSLPVSGQPLDLFNVWTSRDWAWAGRDGFRADSFIQVSYTLNEALRRSYRLN